VQLKGGGTLRLLEPVSVARLLKKPGMTETKLLRMRRVDDEGSKPRKTMFQSLTGSRSTEVDFARNEVYDVHVKLDLYGLTTY